MIIVDVIIIVTVTIGNKKEITFSSVIKNVICNCETRMNTDQLVNVSPILLVMIEYMSL